jgi:predicted SprT family Zn-dependent metalloprotease
MVRSNPAQLILAFESPDDWAAEALRIARLKLPCRREPKVTWASYPTTAGRAFFREFEIRLSRIVLKAQEQIYDTVLHEYAHLAVFEEFGIRAKPHGPEWRAAMVRLGLEPTVTHNYEVERRSINRKLAYRCEVCGFVLRRVRPLKRNRVYFHIGCGGVFSR